MSYFDDMHSLSPGPQLAFKEFSEWLDELDAPSLVHDCVDARCGLKSIAEAMFVSARAEFRTDQLLSWPSPRSDVVTDIICADPSPSELAHRAMERWQLSRAGLLGRLVRPSDTDVSELTQLVVFKALRWAVRKRYAGAPANIDRDELAQQFYASQFFTKWSLEYDPSRATLCTYLLGQIGAKSLPRSVRLAVGLEAEWRLPADGSTPDSRDAYDTIDSILEAKKLIPDMEDASIRLRYEGYSYKEIEMITRVLPASARARVHRYFQATKKRLDSHRGTDAAPSGGPQNG